MPENIQKQLQLKKLKSNVMSGVFDEQKKKIERKRLEKIIDGALFLSKDQIRKKMWLDSIDILSIEEMVKLGDAIIRENMRWKKDERKIEFKEIPKEIISQREKSELLRKITGDENVQDLDFSKKPDDVENIQRLDNMALILLMGLAQVFEQEGYQNFQRARLRLKNNPASFSYVDQTLQKAFQQIQLGLINKNWKNSFARDWADFVDSVADSFVLAKEAESEVTGIKNNFSNVLVSA